MKKRIAIQIRDLSLGYENDLVLNKINLDIYEKEYLGIIGPNGGGKTTLIKAILGLLKPFKGSISIYGEPPEIGRRHIGYVPQFAEYDKDYPISVWDVVLMGRRNKRGITPWYSSEDKKRALEALEVVAILDLKEKQIGSLSGGQRQRVFIARALVSKPKILLLDEPTASVDHEMEVSIYNMLADLNKEITILLVTHDVGVISSYVNRIVCLNRDAFTHDEMLLSKEMLEKSYRCPVDLISHGIPHRVLGEHGNHK